MAHALVEGQPGARALFAEDPGFAHQFVETRRALLRQRVLRRAEHHQLVLDPRLHLNVRMLAVAFDQAQIQAVLGDPLYHMAGVLHVQAYPAFRMGLHEAADQQGGQVVANGQGRPQLQRAEAALALQQQLDFLGAVEQGHRLGQQLGTQGAERQALADAVEQRAVVVALQLGQRGAGRRLRQGQRLGRARHAFQPGDGDEHLHLPQGKTHIDITYKEYSDYSFNGYFAPA
ncbi:hypothetical protein D3C84_503140 [compost metagenome]